MADPEIWSPDLIPSAEDWSLRGGTRSGGQTFQGNEAVVSSPTARWKASLTIPCLKPAQILAMRRVIALGRAQTWLVGPYECVRAPWPYDPILGGLLSDRTPGAQQPAMSFALSGAGGPINATAITIVRSKGGLLAPGMMFSVGGRMHIITDLTTVDPVQAGSGLAAPGPIGVSIRPWLRGNYAAGTGVEFAAPVTVMRLASDDTGSMELQLSRYGTVTLDLVEAF